MGFFVFRQTTMTHDRKMKFDQTAFSWNISSLPRKPNEESLVRDPLVKVIAKQGKKLYEKVDMDLTNDPPSEN